MLYSWLKKNTQKLPLLAIAFWFIALAVHAFWAFDELNMDVKGIDAYSNSASRPHSIMLDSRYAQLEQRAQELSEPLEFMVWPYERQKASKELQTVFHEQINLNPYDAYVWRKLSFIQSAAGTPYEERAWTMLKGIKFGGWMTSERVLLTRHCVAEFDQFDKVIPGECENLITSLPSARGLYALSQDMGVKVRYLKWLLLEHDLEIKVPNQSIKRSRQGE